MRTPRIYSLCCCSVAQLYPTLCDPMDCSTPGFPVLHHLPEFAQTQVHWVDYAIQPSHSLSPPYPPALSLSQHQSLFPMSWVFTSGGQSIGASASALVLPMNIQGWFALGLTGLIGLIYSLNNFHIYHTAVLIILIMLNIISMVLSYLMSGSLYVLTIFIYLCLFTYLFGIFLSVLSVRKMGCC